MTKVVSSVSKQGQLTCEKNSSHAHKTGSGFLLGVSFKISDGQLRLCFYGNPPVGHKPPGFRSLKSQQILQLNVQSVVDE